MKLVLNSPPVRNRFSIKMSKSYHEYMIKKYKQGKLAKDKTPQLIDFLISEYESNKECLICFKDNCMCSNTISISEKGVQSVL